MARPPFTLTAALFVLLAPPAVHAQIEIDPDGQIFFLEGSERPGYAKGPVYVRSGEVTGLAGRYAMHVHRFGDDDDIRAALLQAAGTSSTRYLYGTWINAGGATDVNTAVFGKAFSGANGAHLRGVFFEAKAEGRNQFVYAVYGKATKNFGLNTEGSTYYGGYFEAPGHGGSWAGYFEGRVHVAGDLHYTGTLSQVSDGRLKRDVRDVSGALGKLNRLKPRSYEYRRGEHPRKNLAEGRRYGLVAQEVEAVLPELVTELDHVTPQEFDEEGLPVEGTGGKRESWKAVSYTELIPLLLAGLQEQQAEIAALRAALEKAGIEVE